MTSVESEQNKQKMKSWKMQNRIPLQLSQTQPADSEAASGSGREAEIYAQMQDER